MVSFVFYLIWKYFRVCGLRFDPFNNGFIFDFVFYFILYVLWTYYSLLYKLLHIVNVFKYLFLLSENKNKESYYYCTVHFPEIHRIVLRKITTDLLYFWDVYDVNLWEKKISAEARLIYAEQTSLYNFHRFKKKQ